MHDFEYIDQGLFITLIPITKDADAIWNQIHDVFQNCKIPILSWPSVRSQLRKAKYSVRKAKPVSDMELYKILKELDI